MEKQRFHCRMVRFYYCMQMTFFYTTEYGFRTSFTPAGYCGFRAMASAEVLTAQHCQLQVHDSSEESHPSQSVQQLNTCGTPMES